MEIQVQQVLGNWASSNTVTMRLRREQRPAVGKVTRYAVSLLVFEQTNPQGLHALTADLARLRQELLFETDATGAIANVVNTADLQARFTALEPFLRKKYHDSELVTPAMLQAAGQVLADGQHLARVLGEAPEYALLFPDLEGSAFAPEPMPHRPRRLPRVLGALDLTLQTRAWTVAPPAGVAQAICIEGRPDPAHEQPDEVRAAVRALTGQYNAAADLTVQHLERYELNAAGTLSSAARYTSAAIPGVFFSQTVATLLAATPPAATPAA